PMIENMPFPEPPAVPASLPDEATPYADLVEDTGKAVVDATTRYGSVTITERGTLKVRNDSDLIIDGDLIIKNGGSLLVQGDSDVTVFGHVLVDGGSIELRDEGTLTLYVAGAFVVSNAFIGDDIRLATATETDGTASWVDSRNLVIYSIPGYTPTGEVPVATGGEGVLEEVVDTLLGGLSAATRSGTPDGEAAAATPILDWTLSDDSLVKARLYAPDMDITMEDATVLYGQIIGDTITLRDSAALFYDANLYEENGFLNPPDLALADTWNVHSVIANLPALDPASLGSIADALSLVVIADNTRTEPVGYVAPTLDADALISAASTDRINDVYCEIEKTNLDTNYIEFRTTQRTRAEQQAADDGVPVRNIVIVDTLVAAKDALTLRDQVENISVTAFSPQDNVVLAALTKQRLTNKLQSIDSAVNRGDFDYALASAIALNDAILIDRNNDGGAIPEEPYRTQVLTQIQTLITKLSTMN
ncbi:MAG: hypothetical protein KC983_09435, partial [Phycisphaerales bacterium]|nr:hypothetical protein [Phycisphaerales bacterium]